jgi:hypothetical protein
MRFVLLVLAALRWKRLGCAVIPSSQKSHSGGRRFDPVQLHGITPFSCRDSDAAVQVAKTRITGWITAAFSCTSWLAAKCEAVSTVKAPNRSSFSG